MPTWQPFLEAQQARFQDELLEFLRIPSISAIPAHSEDVRVAAGWVAARLTAAGLEGVKIMPTGGHPVVYGEWLHAPGRPTVMIYGHFDTQPADPTDQWNSPPFEPAVRDGRVYARGASDDKGNMLVPILAVEALMKTDGALPLNVKFFLEGQEEILSPQLTEFVAAQRDLLACDLVLSADGGQWSETEPELNIGCRGACGLQIDVQGASGDLHSGTYGGAVPNPAHALVSILDSMRNRDGTVLVESFYGSVRSLTDTERAAIAAVPFDDTEFRRSVGVSALVGEPGYTPRERMWARPTLEINGIWGGFQGEGMKTVLPATAHAKITCRLVPDQEPDAVVDLVSAHVRRHTPPGVTVELRRFTGSAYPYLVPLDHWGNTAAAAVLQELYGRQPYATRSGGSVPVYALFRNKLDAYTVSFGFALTDEQAHAPNEFFRLKSFERGQAAYCMLLHRLAVQQR
jgi:acetylornithine deacetylase/succinyl-diaminopimelate desuccinylase-like protein